MDPFCGWKKTAKKTDSRTFMVYLFVRSYSGVHPSERWTSLGIIGLQFGAQLVPRGLREARSLQFEKCRYVDGDFFFLFINNEEVNNYNYL